MHTYNPSQLVGNIKVQSEALAESSKVIPLADAGVFEVQDITFPAFSGIAQGDYAVIQNVAGTKFALWMDKDANGTAPSGAAYVASDVKIKLGIATGDTAAQVATKVIAALTAAGTLVNITHAAGSTTAKVKFTQTKLGNAAAPVVHNTEDTGNGSLTVSTVTAPVASSLQNKYILFSSAAVNYAAWFNVNSEGVDPTVATKTMVPIALSAGASVATICAALKTEVDKLAGLTCSNSGTYVNIYADVTGTITDATAGNSGFTVTINRQGRADSYSPSINPTSLAINPAAF